MVWRKRLRVFAQKPQQYRAAIQSASRWIQHGRTDSRPEKNCYSYSSAKNKFFADEYLILLRANGRSAVHVSMGEAG
jgi:hypothetical protein